MIHIQIDSEIMRRMEYENECDTFFVERRGAHYVVRENMTFKMFCRCCFLANRVRVFLDGNDDSLRALQVRVLYMHAISIRNANIYPKNVIYIYTDSRYIHDVLSYIYTMRQRERDVSLLQRGGNSREARESTSRARGFFFPFNFSAQATIVLACTIYALERVKRGGKNTNPNERQYTTLYSFKFSPYYRPCLFIKVLYTLSLEQRARVES